MSTGVAKQTAKGVTRVAPFVFAVSPKTGRIGNTKKGQLIVSPLSLCQLTQGKMAKLLGITRPRLNGLLNKETEPFGIDALLAIAVSAGLTVHLQVTRPYRQ